MEENVVGNIDCGCGNLEKRVEFLEVAVKCLEEANKGLFVIINNLYAESKELSDKVGSLENSLQILTETVDSQHTQYRSLKATTNKLSAMLAKLYPIP